MGISLFLGGSKRLPGWFGALIYRHNGDFAYFLKLVPECPAQPQSARLSAGGWVKSYLGNAQMQSASTQKGLPLLGLLGLKLMIKLQQIHLFQVLNKVWFKIDYSLTMEMHFVWLLKLWRKNKTNVLQWQNYPLSPFLASNFFSIQVKHRPCRCLELQRNLLLQRTQSSA